MIPVKHMVSAQSMVLLFFSHFYFYYDLFYFLLFIILIYYLIIITGILKAFGDRPTLVLPASSILSLAYKILCNRS